MKRTLITVVGLGLLLAACGASTSDASDIPDLPETSVEEFTALLEGLETPAIVNVWASWCIPCRSEAPLLDAAFAVHGDEVTFIGVDVQDNQTDAKAFLAEFGLEFGHFFDRNRTIPNHYAGIGTPITFFFSPGGELISTHNGVIDERTLALGIDEVLRR